MVALAQSSNTLDAPTVAHEPLIVFENVSISFGENEVLKNVSFHVERGQTLCILGRSGVGKSVSLRILMGFLKPDSGSVRFEGQEITELSEDELRPIREKVTMVFQNGALFDSLTVRENIAFPMREREGITDEAVIEAKVDELLKLVSAEDTVKQLPSSLSTGRKRAVAIARALASNPEVILYDEPTTMVDPIISRRMARLIKDLKQHANLTSIVVTHDMRLAGELADLVLFLHLGEAIYFGSLQGFKNTSDENIRRFLELDEYELPK
jgi:phospholipid/cholesterol/gamma-HCH transport system ATP-binding protein